jgi:hypothetical protein
MQKRNTLWQKLMNFKYIEYGHKFFHLKCLSFNRAKYIIEVHTIISLALCNVMVCSSSV